MKTILAVISLAVFASFSQAAEVQKHTASETVKIDFSSKLPAEWKSNIGSWEIKDGKLVGSEVDKDEHAAAARLMLPVTDGSIKLKVKLGTAKAFHIGFDPKKGELKKTGHLLNVVYSPTQIIIMKCKDKADENSKNEVLAKADTSSLKPDEFVDLTVTLQGTKVTVKLGEGINLNATDDSFKVAKPGFVFRVAKGEATVDDMEITIKK